jgi:hypothetical protein
VGVTDDDAEEATELPTAFVATTVNVTGVPLVRLLTVADSTLPTVTALPTDGVTVYPVIAEPLEAGAVQETVAEFVPATAETPVGASGADIVYIRVILKIRMGDFLEIYAQIHNLTTLNAC